MKIRLFALLVFLLTVVPDTFARAPFARHTSVKATPYGYLGVLIPVLLIGFAAYSARKKRN